MQVYLSLWLTACLLALILVLVDRPRFSFLDRGYWRFLLRPWRIALFLTALLGIIGLAPYSGDPTWDAYDGAFMSVLTFLTAPWVTGTIFRTRRFRFDAKALFVALCLWMLSASWSYDLYILLRDGFYPSTWLSNLVLSSLLYFGAGLLFNLTGAPGGRLTLAFLCEGWFVEDVPIPPRRLLLGVLPFIVLAAAVILPLVILEIAASS